MGFVGLARDEETLKPMPIWSRCRTRSRTAVFVLDRCSPRAVDEYTIGC